MEREQTTVRLSTELKEAVAREANEQSISFNAAIIRLLRKGLGWE